MSVEVYSLQEDRQILIPKEAYNGKNILNILSCHYEKRTLIKDKGFQCSEVELRIVVWDNDRGMRDIRFGNQAYSCGEKMSNRYKILQPADLLARLYDEITPPSYILS